MPACCGDDDAPTTDRRADTWAARRVDACARRGALARMKLWRAITGTSYTARTMWFAAHGNHADVVTVPARRGVRVGLDDARVRGGARELSNHAIRARPRVPAKLGDDDVGGARGRSGMPDVRHGRRRAGDGGDAQGLPGRGVRGAGARRGCPLPEHALRSATTKEAFVEAFAKLEREGFDVPGRAAFEDANRLRAKPNRRMLRIKPRAAAEETAATAPTAKIVERPAADAKRPELPAGFLERLNDLNVAPSSVKARRKRLRELMDELTEQAENITSGLYFALCEELRNSYDAAGAAEPRRAWDDPELLLPMV